MSLNKVLCVDDSSTDLTKMKQACKSAGYIVITATSGEEALEVAERELPDAILLDVVMKPMNGFQACRKLGRNSNTKHIPVILVTSKGESADKMWGQEQGAKGYITKPYEAQQLIDKLKQL